MSLAEKIVTFAALLVSACALFVSYQQNKILSIQNDAINKQNNASVWPYVQVGKSWGPNHLRIDVDNDGIGPAKILEMDYVYDDTVFTSVQELATYTLADLGYEPDRYSYSNLEDGAQVIKPGQSIEILNLGLDDQKKMMHLVQTADNVDIRIVYCSIYDKCWVNRNGTITPIEE